MGHSLPQLLFSALFVRASRFGRICTNTTTCKTCKKVKGPISCDRHPDFNYYGENFYISPVLPCTTRYYSSTTKLHQGVSPTVSSSFVPQKNLGIFFFFLFFPYYSTAPIMCQKSLDRDKSCGQLVLVDRPVLTKTFRFLIPSQFTVRSRAVGIITKPMP